MKHKRLAKYRFITIFFLVFAVAFLLLPVFNVWLDPARVFSRDSSRQYKGRHGNINFLKMHFFFENLKKGEFDSLIFGSSRVFYGFDVEDLNHIMPGKWFKFDTPSGNIYDHLHNLQIITKKTKGIKRVLIALDMFDIYENGNENEIDYYRRKYPANLNEWIAFYAFYAFKLPSTTEYDIFMGKLKLVHSPWVEHDNGMSLKKESSVHEKELLSSLPQGLRLMKKKPCIEKSMQVIAQIIDLCNREKIELTFFLNPLFFRTFLIRDLDAMILFKRRLSRIIDYYDYMRINKMTTSCNYWIDNSHFSVVFGKMILKSIKQNRHDTSFYGKISHYAQEEVFSQFMKGTLNNIMVLLQAKNNINYLDDSYIDQLFVLSKEKSGFEKHLYTIPPGLGKNIILKMSLAVGNKVSIYISELQDSQQQLLCQLGKGNREIYVGLNIPDIDLDRGAAITLVETDSVKEYRMSLYTLRQAAHGEMCQ